MEQEMQQLVELTEQAIQEHPTIAKTFPPPTSTKQQNAGNIPNPTTNAVHVTDDRTRHTTDRASIFKDGAKHSPTDT